MKHLSNNKKKEKENDSGKMIENLSLSKTIKKGSFFKLD